jgi:hypothetical protein
MSTRSQAPTPALTRAALVGLAVGAVGSSLLGPGIFAGFAAVALAVGAGITLLSFETGRVLPILGGGLAMLYPLAVIEGGESGILWAATATLIVLAAGFVLTGVRRGVVASLAIFVAVVLHLGLLGSYLVLVAASGNRVLGALVLVVVAFEVVYRVVEGRTRPVAASGGKKRSRKPTPAADLNLKAAGAAVAACVVSALAARLVMDPALGLFSSVVFGASVGAAACLGRASASAVSGEMRSGSAGAKFDPEVFASLNALLLAAGAFYYGFRLYLS